MSWKLRAAISALLLVPQAAYSLGLGDIRLNSALNEPLSAEIDLVAPTNEELGAMSAQLASRELFQRYGLDRPRYLDSVQFQVGRGRDGRNVLLVNSAAPVSEPFVTFLVEVSWPRGRLLREYTVLLDPPVFAPQEAAPPPPVAAPRISRPAPAPTPAAMPSQPRPEPAAVQPSAPAGETPSSYRVSRGDTLYGIASTFGDGSRSGTNRMMIAMFRANPGAFGGNINLLRAGAILRIPGPESVADVSATEASSEIGRQTAAWQGGEARQEPARLRLVTPTEVAPESGAPVAGGANVESRIGQLNREIEESQRLLELKNAELAQLQQQLSEKEAAAALAAAQAPAAEAGEVEAGAVGAEEGPGAAPQAPAEAPAPAPEPEPAAKEPPAAAPAERSFVDSLTDNWTYVLGAAVLLLGGGLAFGFARRRREEDLDEVLRTFEPPPSAPVPSETQRLRAIATGAALETSTEAQEEEDFRTATLPPVRRTDLERPVSIDDTLSTEAPVELDQGDPLAEADFHMAYGLYDQAADIVKLGLDNEPGRRDLKMKLLEIFFVSGNKERFLDAAKDLSASRGDGDAADWDRVQIMGRQLAPDDPLFAGSSGGGVDLNLEGGSSHVDLELLAPPGGDDGLDLDLGEALGASDGEADTGESEVLDFDLDAADQGEPPTAEMPSLDDGTAEMPNLDGGTAGWAELDGATAEIATAEMPTLEVPAGDSPTIEATRLQTAPADTTAEMPMDDLGIDLGDLDALSDGPPEDDVTRIAPTSDSTRIMPSGDDETMDFDISDISPEVASAGQSPDDDETQRIDLDLGAPIADQSSDFTATEQISLEELPQMSDLEPVTMSEVGTKLDLARAYVDMGDPDGARSILEEVLKEGSSSQKQEAQRLLDSLPGA
jgi:pilus assembly protein FimV